MLISVTELSEYFMHAIKSSIFHQSILITENSHCLYKILYNVILIQDTESFNKTYNSYANLKEHLKRYYLNMFIVIIF